VVILNDEEQCVDKRLQNKKASVRPKYWQPTLAILNRPGRPERYE